MICDRCGCERELEHYCLASVMEERDRLNLQVSGMRNAAENLFAAILTDSHTVISRRVRAALDDLDTVARGPKEGLSIQGSPTTTCHLTGTEKRNHESPDRAAYRERFDILCENARLRTALGNTCRALQEIGNQLRLSACHGDALDIGLKVLSQAEHRK